GGLLSRPRGHRAGLHAPPDRGKIERRAVEAPVAHLRLFAVARDAVSVQEVRRRVGSGGEQQHECGRHRRQIPRSVPVDNANFCCSTPNRCSTVRNRLESGCRFGPLAAKLWWRPCWKPPPARITGKLRLVWAFPLPIPLPNRIIV